MTVAEAMRCCRQCAGDCGCHEKEWRTGEDLATMDKNAEQVDVETACATTVQTTLRSALHIA